MKRKLITVDNTKNGYPRIIPMNDNVYSLLNRNKRNEYVFPITTNSLRLTFQRCKKLKIKISDFRHEAISRLFEKGYSIPQIVSISGHRTMSQLFRYAHTKLKAALYSLIRLIRRVLDINNIYINNYIIRI